MSIETIAIIITAASATLTAILAFIVFKMRAGSGTPAADPVVADRMERMSQDMATERVAMNGKMEQVDTKLANLQQTVDQREGALQSQVAGLDGAVRNIVGLFSNDRRRGSWGELTIKRIFELAGMDEGRDYTLQFTDGDRRPDVVVHVPGGHNIIIDSKFPTARYEEALRVSDEEERTRLLVEHGKDVEKTGKALAKKHYKDGATAGFVVMYVPSQAVFEAAMAAHPEVIEHLMDVDVIVTGPTGVFALVKTTGSLMAQAAAIAEAKNILTEVKTVRDRLNVFAGHLGDVGASLTKSVVAFNKAISSWDRRLRPAINKTTEMAHLDEVESVEPVNELVTTNTPQELKEAS